MANISPLEQIANTERIKNIVNNIYNYTSPSNIYGAGHPNALSDGDDKGKGENSNSIGGLTDINTRIANIAKNKYNQNNTYPNF